MTALRLAWKLLLRDWRSGELGLLVAALFIAVTSITSISMLADRLHQKLTSQAAEFMGADLSVSSHRPPLESWLKQASSLKLRFAQITEFSSVLVEQGQFLLVSVKAVSTDYPLRGQFKLSSSPSLDPEIIRQPPAPGEAWCDAQVLTTLGLNLGDVITVGEKPLRVTRLILEEPGFKGGFSSLSPRLVMHQADMPATGIIQPGSRVEYQLLFTGQTDNLSHLKNWLKPQLEAGDRIIDLEEDRPELGKALQRTERYLGMVSIAIVFMAGLAIAMSARRHIAKQYDLIAVLKCLGASNRMILCVSLWQFAMIGVAASLSGCIAGWLLQNLFAGLVRDLLPHGLQPPGPLSWLSGILAGCLILFGFSVPSILGLKQVPPLRVLRRGLMPAPATAFQVTLLGAIVLAILAWHYGSNTMSMAATVGGAFLLIASLSAVLWALLATIKRLGPLFPLPLRLAMQHLTRQPRLTLSQILSFSLTLAAMLIMLTIRTELLQTWRSQLPEMTPNHFALNLFDKDVEHFQGFMQDAGLARSELYPIVRGRLIKVNQVNVSDILKHDSRAESSVNRELSLTWTTELPPDNRVVQGEWHNQSQAGVSVEKGLAEKLGIQIGDLLTFTIAGEPLIATVTSLRTVHWDSMRPNFFMIFSPHQLEAYPHTWLTSFYVAPAQRLILARLGKSFPSITLLDVDKLIGQFQSMLQQVAQIVEFLLLLALLAGFILMLASIRTTLDHRIHEDALLRTLGAKRSLLRRVQWMEFSALGLLAGLVATTLSELTTGVICRYWLEIVPRFHWEAWLLTPVAAALVVGLTGHWSTRRLLASNPVSVLRNGN